MSQWLEFVVNHWFLCAALVALIAAFLGLVLFERVFGVPRLGAQAVVNAINHDDALILDVRNDKDFDKGHIANAKHIMHSEFPERIDKIEDYRNKSVVVVCAMGQQSAAVGNTLRKQGFQQVAILAGGMNHWTTENLPVVKA